MRPHTLRHTPLVNAYVRALYSISRQREWVLKDPSVLRGSPVRTCVPLRATHAYALGGLSLRVCSLLTAKWCVRTRLIIFLLDFFLITTC